MTVFVVTFFECCLDVGCDVDFCFFFWKICGDLKVGTKFEMNIPACINSSKFSVRQKLSNLTSSRYILNTVNIYRSKRDIIQYCVDISRS